ncbi:TSL-kinase interacting protein 1 [Linum perenne]
MRASKKKAAKPADDVPAMVKKGTGLSENSKPAKRTRRQSQKSTGLLPPKDESPLPSTTATVENALPGAPKPSRKIKLQLFPVDENTLRGLEKEGYHPYLELTLSARKKISSVLQHLNTKWGRSSIAVGKPIVFPYDRTGDLSRCRWTSDDTDVCAEDVFVAVGRPSVFRLRYGWFSDSEARFQGMGSLLSNGEGCVPFTEAGKWCNTEVETIDAKSNQLEEINAETEVASWSGARADMISSNALVEPEGCRSKEDDCAGQLPVPWDDGMTNISIGGLLSEASLQGKLNRSDPLTAGSNSTFFTDSFDAFLASQTSSSSRTRIFAPSLTSSILNAEDTCQAFSFQTFASSSKKPPSFEASAFQNGSKEAVLKSVNSQPGDPEGQGSHKSETNMVVSPGPGVLNDESSLGLSGIKWTDSLGPFDLGLTSSRKIVLNDSISLGRIFN